MKKWLFTFLLLIALPVMASHIVGGEFELLHISGDTYRLNLIIYFDKINGLPGAKDLGVTATIYRKRDNHEMGSVFLPLISETEVGYTQPECSHGEIKTSKLIYTSDLTLADDTYNDPQGYYVVWQRCCRNYQITNIYSESPPPGDPNYPFSAGQTFYLEFPPVVMDGQPFYNSSPRLFPPLNDYACPFRPYYVNFAGEDDDGDSVVYSLVTPLNTTSVTALPAASPLPYPDVTWRPGFSLNNIIGGQPDLRISTNGFLTATATNQGLYVFAVKVEQYRDKKKIGESRRDFQMLVVDGCQPAAPPKILGKKLTDATFTYDKTMTVSFDNTVTDDKRCIVVSVSDPDSQSPADNYQENISIKAIPLNFFKKDLSEIMPAVTTATLLNGSTREFSICFPRCPFIAGPFQIGIIAYDDACSLPLTDTLKVAVTIQPPPNTPPYFTTTTPVTAILNEGDSATWTFQAVDAEKDGLIVSLLTDGFVLANAGMKYSILNQEDGLVRGQLHWDAFCNIFDFTKRTSFQVRIRVEDMDQCNLSEPVDAVYNLAVKLPGVADPIIDTDLTPDPQETKVIGLVRKINESLSFQVTGTQAQNDFLVLRGMSEGFKLNDYNIAFAPVSGAGPVTSHFQWDIRCDHMDLKQKDYFEFQFVVLDSASKCRFVKTDTVTVGVTVLTPDNSKPGLVIQSQPEVPLINNQLSITLGQAVALNVLGYDADIYPSKDNLKLRLIEAKGNVPPVGYVFSDATGLGSVESPFTWNPDCSIFENGVYLNDYTFKFSVTDDRCLNIKGDTVMLDLTIKDVDGTDKEFNPPNVITPNDDGCNDYFALEGIEPGCGSPGNPDEFVSLPKDNCIGRFQAIRIYNRWGKQVFESTDRRFRWNALNESAGVYYYLIEYGNQQFKGALSVRP